MLHLGENFRHIQFTMKTGVHTKLCIEVQVTHRTMRGLRGYKTTCASGITINPGKCYKKRQRYKSTKTGREGIKCPLDNMMTYYRKKRWN